MTKAIRFSPEMRERAVRLVREHQAEYPNQWAAITSIASKIGCAAETLRLWVRHAISRGAPVGKVRDPFGDPFDPIFLGISWSEVRHRCSVLL